MSADRSGDDEELSPVASREGREARGSLSERAAAILAQPPVSSAGLPAEVGDGPPVNNSALPEGPRNYRVENQVGRRFAELHHVIRV